MLISTKVPFNVKWTIVLIIVISQPMTYLACGPLLPYITPVVCLLKWRREEGGVALDSPSIQSLNVLMDISKFHQSLSIQCALRFVVLYNWKWPIFLYICCFLKIATECCVINNTVVLTSVFVPEGHYSTSLGVHKKDVRIGWHSDVEFKVSVAIWLMTIYPVDWYLYVRVPECYSIPTAASMCLH